MIKIIELIKESFGTYKTNIKNIILMVLPIALLSLIGQYMNNGFLASWISDLGPVMLFVSVIISFVLMLVTGLYIQPAFYRAIQKNEITKTFNVQEAYGVQSKNIWNFFMLMIWIMLYTLWIIRYYIIGAFVLGVIASGLFVGFGFNVQIGAILMSISVLIVAIGAVINMPKLVFYQNIFFIKDTIRPRDAVRESIELGKQKTADIWKVIFSVIIFSLLIILAYIIAALILILSGFLSLTSLIMINSEMMTPNTAYIIAYVLSFLFSVFFVNPIAFIILAKAYVKLSSDNNTVTTTAAVTEEVVEAEIITPETATEGMGTV